MSVNQRTSACQVSGLLREQAFIANYTYTCSILYEWHSHMSKQQQRFADMCQTKFEVADEAI